MIFLEIKRQLYTKYVLFSIVGVLIITIGLNFILLNDREDINYSLKEESVYEGDIVEDNLLISLKKVRDEKSRDIRYQSQVRIIDSLVKTYPGILYTENKVKDYPDKFAKEFYRCWKDKFEALIGIKFQKTDQNIALDKLNEVKTPFVRYPGYYIYAHIMENLQVVFMMILFLVVFFASAIYSDSFEDGSMEIIKSTKKYKKNMYIRIIPAIIYGFTMILIATIVSISMTSSTVGLNALKSSLKTISIFSFSNFSIGQTILVMVVAEAMGVLALSTLMGYMSLKAKETTRTIVYGVSLSIVYIVGSKMVSNSSSNLNGLFKLIPMSSSNILNSIYELSFNFNIWEPYVILLSSVIVFILSTVVLYMTIMYYTAED